MAFGLETHQMMQDFLKRFDELRRVAFCHQALLDVGKEIVVAKIILEVAILFPVDAQYFGNIQSDCGKMAAETEKGFVFLRVVAVSSDKAAVLGENPIVFPRRTRFGNAFDVGERFADCAAQFGYSVLYFKVLHLDD